MSLPANFLSKNPVMRRSLLLILSLFVLLGCSGIVGADSAATSLTFVTVPSEVHIGDPYQVVGGLQSEDGKYLPNQSVYLEISPGDQFPKQLDHHNSFFSVTNSSGHFLFRQPVLNSAGYCRVRFLGTANLSGSVSSVLKLDSPGSVAGAPAPQGRGSIVIKSEPDHAQVYLDKKPAGNTTAFLSGIIEGPHDVILSKEGFENQTMEIYVSPGNVATISSTLAPPGFNSGSPLSDSWWTSDRSQNKTGDQIVNINNGLISVSVSGNYTDNNTSESKKPNVVTSRSTFDGQSQYSVMVTTPKVDRSILN